MKHYVKQIYSKIKAEDSFVVGITIGSIITGCFIALLQTDKNYQERIFQVVYGRGKDISKVYITVIPNPWPGHSNIFSIQGIDVGALQLNLKKDGRIEFYHKEFYNPTNEITLESLKP